MGIFVITICFIFLGLLFFFLKIKYAYWRERGVQTPPCTPLLGHHLSLWTGARWLNIDKMYRAFKSHKFWGLYEGVRPTLYISDPMVAHDILVSNSDRFTDRRDMKFSGKDKCFNEMLTVLKGENWKSLRALIDPIFSDQNLSTIFEDCVIIGNQMIEKCIIHSKNNKFVDMRNMFHYYVMDATALSTLGIETKCLNEKESSRFIESISYMSKFSIEKFIKFLSMVMFPKIFDFLGFEFTDKKSKVFIDEIDKNVLKREKSPSKRRDLLNNLLNVMKQTKKSSYSLTHNTLVSEIVLFLIAGFETTSSALSFMLYLIAKNKKAQDKLRIELKSAFGKQTLSYDVLMNLPYLNACFLETLRLYPPNHYTERKCTASCKLPGQDLVISEGTLVGIPIWSFHHDEQYFDDPLSFKPERFLDQNVKPKAFMPFGVGPRNCIGKKFAEMETKIAIASLCQRFEVIPCPGHPEMKLDKTVGTLRPDAKGLPILLHELH